MGRAAETVKITARQRKILGDLGRRRSTSQHLSERSRIVLLSAAGRTNEQQADELGIDRQRVRRWRRRWRAAEQVLGAAEAEGAMEKDLRALVVRALSDNERSGAPATYTPEQVASIIALACEPPGDSGLPVSHWTPTELAREAKHRGIVTSISPRQVDRFLARRSFGPIRANIG
jgi:putative transposase